MSLYRSLFPVLDSLHPSESIGERQPREQIFTSPGTWTRPSTVNWVEVLLVGGGGGSGASAFGGGGGGGIRREFVPVTAPVSVTIGAGGTAGTPTTSATVGGTTSFGSVSVGGGGVGVGFATPPVGGAAPTNGGGSGGVGTSPSVFRFPNVAGKYGAGSAREWGGPGGLGIAQVGQAGEIGNLVSEYTYGGGGTARLWGPTGTAVAVVDDGGGDAAGNGLANRGGGAGGYNPAPGYSGGSGIVHVRWWE